MAMKSFVAPIFLLSSRAIAGSSRFNVFDGTCTSACQEIGLSCNATIISRLSSDKDNCMQAAKSLYPKVSIYYAISTEESAAGCMVRLNSSGLHVTVAGSKSTCNYKPLTGWSRVCYCTVGAVVIDKQVPQSELDSLSACGLDDSWDVPYEKPGYGVWATTLMIIWLALSLMYTRVCLLRMLDFELFNSDILFSADYNSVLLWTALVLGAELTARVMAVSILWDKTESFACGEVLYSIRSLRPISAQTIQFVSQIRLPLLLGQLSALSKYWSLIFPLDMTFQQYFQTPFWINAVIIVFVVVLASVSLSPTKQMYTAVPRRCPSVYLTGAISVVLLVISIRVLYAFFRQNRIENCFTAVKSNVSYFGLVLSLVCFLVIGIINSVIFVVLLSNETVTSWWWMILNSIILNLSEILAAGLGFLAIGGFRYALEYKHRKIDSSSTHTPKIFTIETVNDPEFIMGSDPSKFNLYHSGVNAHVDIFTPYDEEKEDKTQSRRGSRASDDSSLSSTSSYFTLRRGFSLIKTEENRI